MFSRKYKLIAQKTILPFLFKIGYYHQLLNKRANNKAIILMYHNIDLSRKDTFGIQMEFIKKHMQPISLNVLINFLTRKKPFPSKSIAITFDDGYANVYHNAYPILKKYQIPATIFLATGYVDTKKIFWWDEIDQIFDLIRDHDAIKEIIARIRRLTQLSLTEGKNIEFIKQSLVDYIKKIDKNLISQILTHLKKNFVYKKRVLSSKKDTNSILSWEQIKQMEQNGIDFSSHTVNHYNLTTLSGEEIEEELKISREIIERELSNSVRGFCYPFGSKEYYNRKVRELVIKAGYQYACTGEFGHVSTKSDIFLLKRVSADNDNKTLSYFVRDLTLALVETD